MTAWDGTSCNSCFSRSTDSTVSHYYGARDSRVIGTDVWCEKNIGAQCGNTNFRGIVTKPHGGKGVKRHPRSVKWLVGSVKLIQTTRLPCVLSVTGEECNIECRCIVNANANANAVAAQMLVGWRADVQCIRYEERYWMHLLSSRLSETRYSRNDCSVYACQHHISMSGLTRNVKKHTNGTSRNERRGSKSGAREIVCQVANETPPTKNLRPRRALNIYDIPYDKHMYYRTLTFAVNVDSILVHVSKLYFLLSVFSG